MNRDNPLTLAATAAGLLYALLSGASAPSLAQTAEQPRSVIGDNAATESDTDLARQIQNPVGDLISLPLRNDINFGYGPHKFERLGRGSERGDRLHSTGPWVAGALVNNIWSLAGTHGPSGNSYSTFLANPFVAYNFDCGWYISAAPNITANWQANGTKWTVPIGGGPGRVFRIGSLPVDLSLGAYYNVVRPSYGAPWQLSPQLTFIF